MKNPYVLMCCLTAAIGGFSFGYGESLWWWFRCLWSMKTDRITDQGVVSVILVMPRFLTRFSEIDEKVTSNAGFYKGLTTAMLELGGVVGALVNSWVADKFSRRRAMQVGVAVFVVC
jgi:MFS family permease